MSVILESKRKLFLYQGSLANRRGGLQSFKCSTEKHMKATVRLKEEGWGGSFHRRERHQKKGRIKKKPPPDFEGRVWNV